jgi:hypothetical protein
MPISSAISVDISACPEMPVTGPVRADTLAIIIVDDLYYRVAIIILIESCITEWAVCCFPVIADALQGAVHPAAVVPSRSAT